MVRIKTAVLVAIVLALHPSALGAEQVDLCGQVDYMATDPCKRFAPFGEEHAGEYLVINAYSLYPGEIVRLVGERVPCPADCGTQHIDSCLVNYTVLPCPAETLGCGVLWGDPGSIWPCWVWESPTYGRAELDWGPGCPCSNGDTVHVVGHLDYTFGSVCMNGYARLVPETMMMTMCADTTTAARSSSWGALKARYR